MTLPSFLTLLEEAPGARLTMKQWSGLLPEAFSGALFETERLSSTYEPFSARPDIKWRVVVHDESDAVAIDDLTGDTVAVETESLRLLELDLAVVRRVIATCLGLRSATEPIAASEQYFYLGGIHKRGSRSNYVTLVLGGQSSESRSAVVQQRVTQGKSGDVVLLPTAQSVSTQLREWVAARNCRLASLDELIAESGNRLVTLPACTALLEAPSAISDHARPTATRKRVRMNVNARLKRAINEVTQEIRRRRQQLRSAKLRGVEATFRRYTRKELAATLSVPAYTITRLCNSPGGDQLEWLLKRVNDPRGLEANDDPKSRNPDCT